MRIVHEKPPCYHYLVFVCISWLKLEGGMRDERIKFPHILGNSERSGAKSFMTNDLLVYGENICAFPHVLGSPKVLTKKNTVLTKFNRVLPKFNTVLTKFNTVLTKKNAALTKVNRVLMKKNSNTVLTTVSTVLTKKRTVLTKINRVLTNKISSI